MLRLVVRLSLSDSGLCVAKKMPFSVLSFCSVDLIFEVAKAVIFSLFM